MSETPKIVRHCWDTCVLLAWVKDEVRPTGEMDGVIELATKVHKREVALIESVLIRAEILRSSLAPEAILKLDQFLARINVQEVETDFKIWNLAHDLRDYYLKKRDEDKLPTLTTPDAVHLATAIHYEVDVFYTFDRKDEKEKRRALLPLSGNVAGYQLKIEKPMGEPNLFTK